MLVGKHFEGKVALEGVDGEVRNDVALVWDVLKV